MYTFKIEHRVKVSYEKRGQGLPLVLVHGAFSDHRSNWEFVLPALAKQFTVYSVARRGRGETDATEGHSLEEEGLDVATLIGSIPEPVYLLGHSYGALVALSASCRARSRVRKLVLYEAPLPEILGGAIPQPMAQYAKARDWDAFSYWFFRNILTVPAEELNALRRTNLWRPITTDAQASLGDLSALSVHRIPSDDLAELRMPVLLQIGTESPRHLYATDILAALLADVRIDGIEGQAHEAMTTAPKRYANSVISFLAA
jgi:pimeloyl-ACP methyl ester carboxylesterase